MLETAPDLHDVGPSDILIPTLDSEWDSLSGPITVHRDRSFDGSSDEFGGSEGEVGRDELNFD